MAKSPKITRVKFTQSGGFAGLIRGCDFRDPSSTDMDHLQKILQRVDLKKLARDAAQTPALPDTIQYSFTVESESGSYEATFSDAQIDQSAQSLIQFVAGKSKPIKP